jgi:predicted nucleic acid-binding protein
VNWLRENTSNCAVSTVVIAELGFGIASIRSAERSPRLEQHFIEIRRRFSGRIYPFDLTAALICAKTMGDRQQAGHIISMSDGMIAAIALRHGAALATRNTKHFEGMGLPLINPWTD